MTYNLAICLQLKNGNVAQYENSLIFTYLSAK